MATVLELAIREGSGIEILGEPQERLALMSGDLQTIPASKGFSLKHYRLSPVFRNNRGMLGYMSLGIMRYGLDAYLKKWGHDETYFDGVDVLKVLTENPDAFMEWSLLAGVIDIPETIIESLKCEKERAMGSRKRRVGTDRDFINAFGLSQFTDELNIPGFNSDEFGLNGKYRCAYHPDSHNPNLFDRWEKLSLAFLWSHSTPN